METKDIGKRFVLWGTLFNPPRKKILFRQPTHEYDPPYRYSNAVVIRFWRWGLMLGKWQDSPEDSLTQHLVAGVSPSTRLTLDELEKLEPSSGPDYPRW